MPLSEGSVEIILYVTQLLYIPIIFNYFFSSLLKLVGLFHDLVWILKVQLLGKSGIFYNIDSRLRFPPKIVNRCISESITFQFGHPLHLIRTEIFQSHNRKVIGLAFCCSGSKSKTGAGSGSTPSYRSRRTWRTRRRPSSCAPIKSSGTNFHSNWWTTRLLPYLSLLSLFCTRQLSQASILIVFLTQRTVRDASPFEGPD